MIQKIAFLKGDKLIDDHEQGGIAAMQHIDKNTCLLKVLF